MLCKGRRGLVKLDGLRRMAETHSIPPAFYEEALETLQSTLARWPGYARAAGLGAGLTETIERAIRGLRV